METDDWDDRVLLGRVAEGCEDAFSELYRRYAEAVAAFATLRDVPVADLGDLTGNVWLACWRSAGSFRGDSGVKTWLFGIVSRQVASRRRDVARQVEREVLVGDVPDRHGPNEPLLAVLVGEQRSELVAALRELQPGLYETVVLAWVEELPYPDIARLQGIPVGTVKSRIHAARRQLAPRVGGQKEAGA